MCLWVSTPTMTMRDESTISLLCDMRRASFYRRRHGLIERADRTVMGLFGQAPIGSLPTRSNRIWVSAARPKPTDQRKDTRSLIRRGQTWSNSSTIMLTVVRFAAAADGGFEARIGQPIGVAHGEILTTPIAVMDQVAEVVATALVDRLLQGVEDEVRPERR